MSKNKSKVKLYEYDIKNLKGLELSPFELIETLHVRDTLLADYENLDNEEKEILAECDRILLDNAEQFYQQLDKVHDWDYNQKSLSKWWWHLDKLVAGKLKIDLDNYQLKYKDKYYIGKGYFLKEDNNLSLEKLEEIDNYDKYNFSTKISKGSTDANDHKLYSQSSDDSDFPIRVA